MKKFIRLHAQDNVMVALAPLAKGETVELDGISVELVDDVEKGHKVALQDIAQGDNVIKYGAPIGHALRAARRFARSKYLSSRQWHSGNPQ